MDDIFTQSELPEFFFDLRTGKPFEKCIECERNLLLDNVEYMIEKGIRNFPELDSKDVVFDFAICKDCGEGFQTKLSEESKTFMESFFSEHPIDMFSRIELFQKEEWSWETLTEKCVFTDQRIEELNNYQIVGHFRGRKMLYSIYPFAVSGDFISGFSEGLSKETKDELGGFSKKVSPLPGELKDLFQPTPLPIF